MRKDNKHVKTIQNIKNINKKKKTIQNIKKHNKICKNQ